MSSSFQIVQPSGILDSTQATQFRQEIEEIVTSGTKIVLIDLKDVTFMDSSGLATIAVALKSIRAIGGQLCVCSLNEQVKILFELTSMTKVLEIFSNREEFVSAFSQ